jgi:hypothetical protein
MGRRHRSARAAQTRLAQAQALVRSGRLYLLDAGRLWDDVLVATVRLPHAKN